MPRALVGLGANLGEREATLAAALREIGALPGVRTTATSRWRETAPVGGPSDQARYLNGAATFHVADEDPLAFWRRMAAIETRLGRERATRWGPRTIDLDLLLFDELVLDSPELVLPHPRLATRRFVLEPAAEIASDWKHPTSGWTIGRLREHLDVAPNVARVACAESDAAERLAERLRGAPELQGRWDVCAASERERGERPGGVAREMPKLLVLLDGASPESVALRRAVESRRDGPYLVVDSRDSERAAAEALAALVGMT